MHAGHQFVDAHVLVRLVVARQWYSISLLKALGYSDREVGRLYLDNYLWLVAASVAIAGWRPATAITSLK